MGFWTGGRTDRRSFEKTTLQNPLPRVQSNEKGVGKNTRAFSLGCADSISAAFLILVGPRWDNTGGKTTFVNFTNKKNASTGGSTFFASTDLSATKSTDTRAVGFWTDARPHARTRARTHARRHARMHALMDGRTKSRKLFFQTPLHE